MAALVARVRAQLTAADLTVDGAMVVDSAVNLSATIVVDVNGKGGAHVLGAVNDYARVNQSCG